ncbi:hypothetical protein D3C86_1506220 [compost metagenome]
MVVEVTEKPADLLNCECRLVLGLVCRDCLADRPDRVRFGPQGRHSELEHGRHRPPGLCRHGWRPSLDRVLKNTQDVHRGDISHRHRADLWKDNPVHHVQASLLGDRLPVLGLQPLLGDKLKRILRLADLSDPIDLSLLSRTDTLLHELARALTELPCLRQLDVWIVAQRVHTGIAVERITIPPRLHSRRLDLQVEAFVIVEPIQFLPWLCIAAMRIREHELPL